MCPRLQTLDSFAYEVRYQYPSPLSRDYSWIWYKHLLFQNFSIKHQRFKQKANNWTHPLRKTSTQPWCNLWSRETDTIVFCFLLFFFGTEIWFWKSINNTTQKWKSTTKQQIHYQFNSDCNLSNSGVMVINENIWLFSVTIRKLLMKSWTMNPPITSSVVFIVWWLGHISLTDSPAYDFPITSSITLIRWWLGDNQKKKCECSEVRIERPCMLNSQIHKTHESWR